MNRKIEKIFYDLGGNYWKSFEFVVDTYYGIFTEDRKRKIAQFWRTAKVILIASWNIFMFLFMIAFVITMFSLVLFLLLFRIFDALRSESDRYLYG